MIYLVLYIIIGIVVVKILNKYGAELDADAIFAWPLIFIVGLCVLLQWFIEK